MNKHYCPAGIENCLLCTPWPKLCEIAVAKARTAGRAEGFRLAREAVKKVNKHIYRFWNGQKVEMHSVIISDEALAAIDAAAKGE